MSDERLGQIELEDRQGERDAVHVPIACVMCSTMLYPGQRVAFQSAQQVVPCADGDAIVDPFITRPIPAGTGFWVMMVPGSTGAVRHHWEHSAFTNTTIPSDAPVEDDDYDDGCQGCY